MYRLNHYENSEASKRHSIQAYKKLYLSYEFHRPLIRQAGSFRIGIQHPSIGNQQADNCITHRRTPTRQDDLLLRRLASMKRRHYGNTVTKLAHHSADFVFSLGELLTRECSQQSQFRLSVRPC